MTPGGHPAPLGARGGTDVEVEAGTAVGGTAVGGTAVGGTAVGGAGVAGKEVGGTVPSLARLDLSTRLLLIVLGTALLGYAAVAADVVNAGRLSERDVDVATWVAGSMPSWAEWVARPFTWLGGAVGVTAVVAGMTIWLLTRRARVEAALLLVVTLGIQVLVFTAKDAYARPRPDVGSAIALPSSYSFPSGHAATGVAVFGLLGLLASTIVQGHRRRVVAVFVGFAVGALIGTSRVVLGVHYVTDVLAGGFLGLAWLSACLLVALRLLR